MKIEEGKYYKTRDDRTVGPMERWDHEYSHAGRGDQRLWETSTGKWYIHESNDLIYEWPEESPVRTVTKREIVPGVYGKVRVYEEDCDKGHACLKIGAVGYHWTSPELRAAAATLIEIADALEDV